MLPESFSTFGPDIDRLYYIILWVTGITFVITEGLLFWFLVKYRHTEGRKAEPIHGHSRAEVIWTAATLVIVSVVGFMSVGVWHRVKMQVPADAMEMIVTATQFEWNAVYPGPDGTLGTPDDFEKRNEIHAVVNRPIVVYLRSDDVIHSFFLPHMRVKQDAMPGMEIPVWWEPTATGTYPLGCAELCGGGHYSMSGTLTVHTEADYATWMQAQAGG